MTHLIGLKMQGIRSIGETPHVINFLDPLTIIQGANGTGKTTTIEALNYITTGAMPAGRLASFIHNNKLSKKKRVDALIQLHFRDFRGNDVTATKRMCAAQSGNKGKITTKSDEFSLKIIEPNGRTRSETAKVADFNKQIEGLFGVPAAILQHVIFCHQEESTWPLGEPKELKTKFDAIFEVEKFVKVMDSLKKMAKGFEDELKLIKTELPHLQRQMLDTSNKFLQLETNKRKVAEIKEFLRQKEQEKTVKENAVRVLREECSRAVALERLIDNKQAVLDTQKDNLKGRLKNCTPYNGTKEDLQKELDAIKNSTEFTESAKQKENAQTKKVQLEKSIPEMVKKQRGLQDMVNKIEGQRLMLESLQKERTDLITESLESYRLKVDPAEFVNALTEQLNQAESNLNNFKKGKESMRSDHTKKINDIRDKISTHTSVDKLKRGECTRLRDQISKLEKELAKTTNSDDRITQIQQEIADRVAKINKLQSERNDSMDALKQKLYSLDVFPNVSVEMSDIESLASRFDELILANNNSFTEFIRETAGEKAVLSENARKDLEERKTLLSDTEKEMKQAFQSLQPLRNELNSAEETLKKFNKDVDTEREMLANRATRIKGTLERLRSIDAKLKQHSDGLESQNADELRQQMDEIEKKLEDTRKEISRLITVIAQCDNQQQKIRALQDQQQIFELQHVITTLDAEIADARSKIARPSHEVNRELSTLANEVLTITNEVNRKLGSKKTLNDTEKDLRNALKGESMDEIKKKLKQKVVSRVSLETATKDLRKLAKVMDDSIIEYHSQKMEQINSILGDLWPRVYQGNDIESIQIRSQPIEGTEKRKSYDYSVIMVVDQVDIEMRDRCSAGQKMLASILIRIALAEVFGGNCPILALDEPTTNLDAIKVENMGTILKDLLEACRTREHHHNLQLIVITHDKRLVEHLYTACRPEYVYGLSKNEHGISQIRAHRSVSSTGGFNDDGDILEE